MAERRLDDCAKRRWFERLVHVFVRKAFEERARPGREHLDENVA
jgi:hypothetical protein